MIIWPGLYVMAFQPNALPPAEENAEDISPPTLEISSEVHRWTLWAFEDAWGQYLHLLPALQLEVPQKQDAWGQYLDLLPAL
jgi:hypothetical protein